MHHVSGDWWHVPPQSQQDSRQDVDRIGRRHTERHRTQIFLDFTSEMLPHVCKKVGTHTVSRNYSCLQFLQGS